MENDLSGSEQISSASESPSEKNQTLEKGYIPNAVKGVLTTCPSSKQESWESGTISTSKDGGGGPEGRAAGLKKRPLPKWNPQGSQGRPD